jgi:hypothetical protein
MNSPFPSPADSFEPESRADAALEQRRPPFVALFAATGLFTVAALTLITFTLVAAVEPLRAAMQAAKNAPAAQGQPAAGAVALAKIDLTNSWIVFGLIAGASAALLLCSWLLLREGKQKSAMRINPLVYGTVVLTVVGMMFTMLNDKNMPEHLSSFIWPLMLSVVAIPIPFSYVAIRWFAWRMGRGMERICHTPVRFSDLPTVSQRFFELFTTEMEALGFRHVADYRLKRHTPFFCRVLLSEDNCAFGEIVTQRLFSLFTMKCCTFATIFESGDYLESANLATKTHDVGRYHTRMAPGASLEKLYAAHLAAVEEISEQNATQPARCKPQDYPKISTYGHKLMYDRLVEEGIAGRNIYDEAETARA